VVAHYFLHAPAELPPAQLKLPKPVTAQLEGFDLVYDAFSPQWKGRIASLHPKPGGRVYGLLYKLTPAQLKAVEKWRAGEQKIEIDVKAATKTKAIAFTTPEAKRTEAGDVSQQFVFALAQGAEQAKLPKDYVERLKAEAAIVQRVQTYGHVRGIS
jgi:gamma-glutamylcyclotransferase